MSVLGTLFPVKNRTAAGVAFIRTSWQTLKATSFLGSSAGLILTGADLATINWTTLGLGAAAAATSAILAGALAGGDILVHGLPTAYSAPEA